LIASTPSTTSTSSLGPIRAVGLCARLERSDGDDRDAAASWRDDVVVEREDHGLA
jgi:hypothetical protein